MTRATIAKASKFPFRVEFTAGVLCRSQRRLTDGTPVTIFMRKPALRETGILPKGGILRLYGRAKIHKSGAVYEEIWNRLIEAEKKGDPEKRGYAVLVTIERAEDLSGQPLT